MLSSEITRNANGRQAVDMPALLGRCLGNFKIVERVLATFLESGKSDLVALQCAIESEAFVTAAELSHRLHGAAGNVSATGLRELFKHAEQLSHDQNHPELMMMLGQLQLEWERFERFAQVVSPAASVLTGGQVKPSSCSLETSHAGASC